MLVSRLALVLITTGFVGACGPTIEVERPSPAAPPPTATAAAPQLEQPAPAAAGSQRPAPPPSATAATAEADHAAVDALHAQGIYHQVGDYRLQMDTFDADATADVLAVNQFNQPPTEGAYAVATWTVTYTGTAEGAPYVEIGTAVMGGDGVQYDHTKCPAVLEDGLLTTTRVLNPGGTLHFATCYDAPRAALAGATAVRAGTLSRTDRVDWSTKQ